MSANVDLSVRQFAHAWSLMCSGSPQASIAGASDIDYVFSGLPIAFFNVALVTGHGGVSAGTLRGLGHDACSFASGPRVPWMFVVTNESLQPGVDATSALQDCALVPVMSLTGMMARHVAPAARMPAGLELAVPHDDAGYASTMDINGLAYAMDLEAGKSLLGKATFWKDHVAVVGMAEGKPVCCAAALSVDGHRYVAMVATDPAWQRRGFADAAMRQALDVSAAAYGDRPTVLHATDAGRPVYERMGYEVISTHTVFMEKRFIEGH